MLKGKQREIYKDIIEQHKDELEWPCDELAEQLGADGFIALCDLFGGSNLYIPTIKRVLSKLIAKRVIQENDGGNVKQLASKYSVSDRTIYNWISEYRRGKRKPDTN